MGPSTRSYFLTLDLTQSNRIPAPGRNWGTRKRALSRVILSPPTAGAVIVLISQRNRFGEGKPDLYSLSAQGSSVNQGFWALGGLLFPQPSPRPRPRPPNIQSPGHSTFSSSQNSLASASGETSDPGHSPPQFHLPLEGSCLQKAPTYLLQILGCGSPPHESSPVHQLLF